MQSAQHRMHFSQPHHVGHGRPFPLLPATVQRGRILYATPRQTCPQPRPRAQIAFKDLMIHGILQFTLSIAFRYVLHRNESRDIRCRESFPESMRRRDESQWIVAARPLCHLQYPVAYLSRLHRILLADHLELNFKAAPTGTHIPIGVRP